VLEADVILHVRDAAHGETEAQKKDVLKVLSELGVEPGEDRPLIEVLNKIDLLEPGQREGLLEKNRAHGKGPIAISAVTGEGLDALLARLQSSFAQSQVTIELALDPADGAGLAWAHEHGHVLDRRGNAKALRLTVAVDRHNLDRFLHHYGEDAHIREATRRIA
jgi:GTPase